ncbi:MMPL family transporter [Rhodococcus triatomae]|uniref:Putative drug exporter of the RND superfamily n=1 Tax=Rhodococcus triatomae TaxID=300028 RepID=A0A1G8LBA3_9NOCA|nr:MMPL family transporter [Rhodococcus triatomae]QNG20554.1 MMPL family transporter [Rhodococcus triatomae]QNG23528.1 MMPL family transporter [Rhodococcus triatomae]SDI52999.1 putative drug exporter of the RND superfamily [Rhodococcus triatomae]
MSLYLYRLGKFAFRRKWLVLPVWLVLLVALGALASTVSKPMEDDFTMPNLPSERATEIMDRHFPGMSAEFDFDAVTGTYVIAAPEGTRLTDAGNVAAIDSLVAELGALDIVDHSVPLENPVATAESMGCLSPERATDEFTATCSGAPLNVLATTNADTVALLDVPFTIDSWQDITPEDRAAAFDAADGARDAGLAVELSGSIAMEEEMPGGTAELIGMGVALIVMIIAFGAIVAAFVPIITAIVGLGAATMVILAGTAVTTIPTFTTFLASMIGIALSIDYALFIVSRYKHELVVSDSPEEAAGRAVGTAGSAVVFAGLTVIIALSGLSIVGVDFLTYMGLGGALAAAFAVIVALTLMPALLGAFGRFLFTPKIPFVAKHDPEDDRYVTNGQRIARLIGRFPAVTLVAGIVLLGVLAAPAINLNLGLPGDESAPTESTIRQAYELRTEGFGEGSNGVLQIAVDLEDVPDERRDEALDSLRAELESYGDMDYVVGPTPSEDGAGALFQAVPMSGPNNQATKDLVKEARGAEASFADEYGMEYGVTGTTAIFADVDDKLLGSIAPYMSIVAGAAFLLLILVFRSILVPLTAALGFLLSMAATFGATVLIFQEGALGLISDPQPIVSFLPIMLIGLVFGLAMDYQVFLVTRMREEYVHGASPKEAMVNGYHHGARVVTAAAIIMISVFSAFMLEDDVAAKSMGFALAAGVLFDAFIVRMVIIPSLLALMGDSAWWIPKWLDRILPNIDVEGQKLAGLGSGTKEAKPQPQFVD